MEVLSHLYVAHDLGYIEKDDMVSLKEKIVHISKMLSGLRKSQTLNPKP